MVSKLELSLSYSLSCLRLEGLEMRQQPEAIQTIYNGKTCYFVCLQSMVNLCVTRDCPSCLTICKKILGECHMARWYDG